jgi:hypothetical protein
VGGRGGEVPCGTYPARQSSVSAREWMVARMLLALLWTIGERERGQHVMNR